AARRVEPVGRLPRAGSCAIRPAPRPRRAVPRVSRRRGPRRSRAAGSIGRTADVTERSSSSARVAVVTGGTRGIGLGIARALARDGWQLALCGRRPEESVRAVVDELKNLGADALYRVIDVARTSEHAAFVSAIVERWGGVNALVNNAGRGPRVRADLLDA